MTLEELFAVLAILAIVGMAAFINIQAREGSVKLFTIWIVIIGLAGAVVYLIGALL